MNHDAPLLQTDLNYPLRRGKVRDVYDIGSTLMIVSTDRISAFDWILPTGIPGKGRLLTKLSQFWFGHLGVAHHLISGDVPAELACDASQRAALEGRVMIARKAEVIPFECVVRGYLEGSGWREYQHSGAVCGIRLPAGLQQCDRLPEPIFTPATKAEQGHDENVSFETMAEAIGLDLANRLRSLSLEVYSRGCKWAESRGLIIADTKFEWGHCNGEVILIDEVLTPDSSRYWPADQYQPGQAQASFDKQYVREWLMASGWDRNSPPPEMPAHIVAETARKYQAVLELLTG